MGFGFNFPYVFLYAFGCEINETFFIIFFLPQVSTNFSNLKIEFVRSVRIRGKIFSDQKFLQIQREKTKYPLIQRDEGVISTWFHPNSADKIGS